MGNFDRNSVFSLATAEASPACLARWHSRWLDFCPVRRDSSTFLCSLRSVPITGLPRYYGHSDSCWSGSSAPVFGQHERRSSHQQVSLIHVSDLPTPPSPTTPQALDIDFARYPSSRRVSRSRGSRLHLSLAGSPTLTGRIEFVILRMDRSPPAAPHPASRTDAVAVGYRPESVYLKRTFTSPIKHAFRRTRDGPPGRPPRAQRSRPTLFVKSARSYQIPP
jgi:hypothetical protein